MKTSMLIGPAIMLVHKQYLADIEENKLVIFAFAATVFTGALLAYLYDRISRNQQPGSVTYSSKDSKGQTTQHTVSIKDYDQIELKKLFGKLFLGTAIVAGLYSWKGFTQPLVIQPIMSIVQLFENQLAQIYLLGKAATGGNARPFKEDNPLAGLLGQNQNQNQSEDDAAAAAATETVSAQPTAKRIDKKKS